MKMQKPITMHTARRNAKIVAMRESGATYLVISREFSITESAARNVVEMAAKRKREQSVVA